MLLHMAPEVLLVGFKNPTLKLNMFLLSISRGWSISKLNQIMVSPGLFAGFSGS